jgi:hypothetical protein
VTWQACDEQCNTYFFKKNSQLFIFLKLYGTTFNAFHGERTKVTNISDFHVNSTKNDFMCWKLVHGACVEDLAILEK